MSLVIQFLSVLGFPILALASKSPFLHTVLFGTAVSFFAYILVIAHPDIPSNVAQFIGLFGSSYLATAFDLLFLVPDVQATHKPNDQIKPASQLSFWPRVKWAAKLMFNVRNANWNCEIRGLRHPKVTSRWDFVRSQIMRAGCYYLIGDLMGATTRRLPAFQYPPVETLTSRGLVWQAVYTTLFWGSMCTLMNRVHITLSIIFVSTGVSAPDDWPVLFGDWSKTKSMRTFWGRSWHQGMRRAIQPHSKFLTTRILRLQPKGLLSTYIELSCCFFISGIYHAIAEWMASCNPSMALDHLVFFFYLTSIIISEDFVIFIGKKMGINNIPTIVSYLWVVLWMTLASRNAIQAVVNTDNYKVDPGMSVVEMVLGNILPSVI